MMHTHMKVDFDLAMMHTHIKVDLDYAMTHALNIEDSMCMQKVLTLKIPVSVGIPPYLGC